MRLKRWIRKSNEEAFLLAIDAEPWDQAHYLVYADWLDEHGDEEDAAWMRAFVANLEANLTDAIDALHAAVKRGMKEHELVMLARGRLVRPRGHWPNRFTQVLTRLAQDLARSALRDHAP